VFPELPASAVDEFPASVVDQLPASAVDSLSPYHVKLKTIKLVFPDFLLSKY
jgi:hypothetical protein